MKSAHDSKAGAFETNDLKRFWDAVMAMRAAQKLEWAALPSNFDRWRRARQKQTVAQLEEQVDALAEELSRTYRWTDDEKGSTG